MSITPTTHITNILIAEDHALFSDGIKILLEELLPEAQIQIEADFSQVEVILDKNPSIELLMLDLKLPGTSGLNGLKNLRQQHPTLTIIVVSALDVGMNIQQTITLGANGFIAKSTSKQQIQQAIVQILSGDIVIKSDKVNTDSCYLSKRQMDTLKYLAQGKTNKEIAKSLNVMPSTAKEHVSNVISVLGAKNRTQAVLNAQRIGLLIEYL